MFNFFSKKKKDSPKPENDKLLAVTSLLVEAALIDMDFGKNEREIIGKIVKRHFSLSEEYDIEMLIDKTVSDLESSGDLITHTRKIKENWELKDRVEIIEMMWKVCLIDNKIEPYEDMLIRRVSGLIYVSDKDRRKAKSSAINALKQNERKVLG